MNKNTNALLEKYAKVIKFEYQKQMIAKNLVATGASIKQVNAYVTKDSADVSTLTMPISKPLAYVEFGRRPGKRPPIAKIREWMRIKGISGVTDKKTKTIAWAISRNIGAAGTIKRFGYKGARLSDIVMNQIGDKLMSELREAYSQDLRDMLDARS